MIRYSIKRTRPTPERFLHRKRIYKNSNITWFGHDSPLNLTIQNAKEHVLSLQKCSIIAPCKFLMFLSVYKNLVKQKGASSQTSSSFSLPFTFSMNLTKLRLKLYDKPNSSQIKPALNPTNPLPPCSH